MQLRLRCLLLPLAALLLAGCPTRAPPPGSAPGATPTASHLGVAYAIAPAESLLTIRVYKAGTLAAAGHNHLIASHELTGTLYLPAQVLRSELRACMLPVARLTVDEAALRALRRRLPAEVPDSAREGTRHNMLGAALLDGTQFPQITLRAVALEEQQPPLPGTVRAHVQVTLWDAAHEIVLPVRYQRSGSTVTVDGATALRQSELGLKPFSALLGALQVQDEMQVSVHLVAHAGAAPTARLRAGDLP